MNAQTHYVRVQDGMTIRIAEWGQGSGCCLLVHGFGDGVHVWPEFAERLAADCRVLAVDLRGHGESGWDIDRRYNIRTYSEDLQRVMEALPSNRIVLVGHSLGGEVAMRLAAANGHDIAGLVLVDCALSIDQETVDHIFAEFNQETGTYASTCEYAERLESKRPLTAREILERLARDALKEHSPGVYRLGRDPALAEREERDDDSDATSWALLPAIKCPTLMIRGAGSSVLSKAVAARMNSQMPGSKLKTIAMAGHNVMLDNPDAFYQACSNFILAQLSGRAGY
jgi:pimeloyl-ACP methyl ester carboxylesterase